MMSTAILPAILSERFRRLVTLILRLLCCEWFESDVKILKLPSFLCSRAANHFYAIPEAERRTSSQNLSSKPRGTRKIRRYIIASWKMSPQKTIHLFRIMLRLRCWQDCSRRVYHRHWSRKCRSINLLPLWTKWSSSLDNFVRLADQPWQRRPLFALIHVPRPLAPSVRVKTVGSTVSYSPSYSTLVQVSEILSTRASSYCQRLSHVKLRPLSEIKAPDSSCVSRWKTEPALQGEIFTARTSVFSQIHIQI